MDKYYFAFKVNPIDAMRMNFPRPSSQDFGVVCCSREDAQKWLNKDAVIPENAQDWLYERYQLPAVDMIITAQPISTVPKLPEPMPGEAISIFAHRMRQFEITNIQLTIGKDEVHRENTTDLNMSGEYNIDNPLLQSACSEMLTRMADIHEYNAAWMAHPDIPLEAIKCWATMMYDNDIHLHTVLETCFDTFATHYQQEVAIGEQYGPQYGVEPTMILAMESAACYLSNELMHPDAEKFEGCAQELANIAHPYRKERFMTLLLQENYKEIFLEKVPEEDKETASKLWDDTHMNYRIANQVELRTGKVRPQDITLQTAIQVATDMEYDAFRSSNGKQYIYAGLRSDAMRDEVRLEQLDNFGLDEQETALE